MNWFKHISVCLTVALASGSTASAQSSGTDALLYSQGCRMIGQLAEAIMSERKKDVPISEMMTTIRGSVEMIGFDGVPIDENSLSRIVLIAYKVPRYHNSELQQDAISTFRNTVEGQCYNKQLEGE